jgi:addiction module HigA family antidote
MDSAAPKIGLRPMHPGELLREDLLPALKAGGVPRTAVAEALGVSRRTLYDMLEEKLPVSAEMAVKLGAAFGNSAEFWANLQQAYDLAQARAKLEGQLPAKIEYEAA